MKVEIWSDVVCPFCYIGKRKFEKALETFSNKEQVEIVWRSFQLDPTTKSNPGKSVIESLAEKKGLTLTQSQQMHAQVTAMAKEVGLDYQMDKSVIANTFDAHRLSLLAATQGLQNKMEERLFAAYFTEGKDIANKDTLVGLAKEVGLDEADVTNMLQSNAYNDKVEEDILEAQQVGVRGVPFFVFDNKYAVSGAQPTNVFSQVLTKVWEERVAFEATELGTVCTPDGVCN
ncbi:DSBA oxidoreductase [Flavisolibacter tropicus]|uniref:DSBA oxidoreductase n=2 Tax=Flavisolibacter tropicus TaxID=1492898 RepID=A0A172U3H4_9BACT|nr:DSBA oxidoreductase [Flavisolibacter tropicus]